MEKFINLPVEKQKIIIDAALKSFSSNGYKKTSVSDIAAAAGISKAMVFHYFGTKKALYFYLMDLCFNLLMNEMNEKFDSTVTDFFERIKLLTDIEIAVMKKHPAVPAFLTSMYFEEDDEVKEDIKGVLIKGEEIRNKMTFDGMDFSKFKESVDLRLLMKMFSWMADGYASQLSKNTEAIDYDALCEEFFRCMDLLKMNFYKAEHLPFNS